MSHSIKNGFLVEKNAPGKVRFQYMYILFGGANEKMDEPQIISKDCFVIRAAYERK